MSADQLAAYTGWLTAVARRARGRLADRLRQILSDLEGNEWGFMP